MSLHPLIFYLTKHLTRLMTHIGLNENERKNKTIQNIVDAVIAIRREKLPNPEKIENR